MTFRVELYVYDLSMGLAAMLSQQFTGKHFPGIWHTGIVIYNTEYFFGGGIQKLPKGQTPYGTPVRMIHLGDTEIDQSLFEEFVNQLSNERFRFDQYHLFDNNCNHFTNECSLFLLGKSIPNDILDLPLEFFNTPMGQMIRPMVDRMMGGARNPNVNVPTSVSTTSNNSSVNNSGGVSGSNVSPFGSGGGGGFGGGFGGNNNMNDLMGGMNPNDLMGLMNNPMVSNLMNNPNMMNQVMNMMNNNPNLLNNFMGNSNFNTNNLGSMNTMNTTNNTTKIEKIFEDPQEVYHFNKANITQIINKLKTTTSEEIIKNNSENLIKLERYLNNQINKLDNEILEMIELILRNSKENESFPILDIIRLIAINTEYSNFILNKILPIIEEKFILNTTTTNHANQLMILRLFCNLFDKYFSNQLIPSNTIKYLIKNKLTIIVDFISNTINSELEGIRLVSSSLAANLSLFLKIKNKLNNNNTNLTDEEIQLFSSMLEFIKLEKSKDNLQRMLFTIFRLIKNVENFKEEKNTLKEIAMTLIEVNELKEVIGKAYVNSGNEEKQLVEKTFLSLLF
ncbi:hypothetical protein ABK040_002476 [Willaertia magna]